MKIKIAHRFIGDDELPLILPDVGINHEGDIEKALLLVDAAANAGAEAIKFQTHFTEKEMIHTDMKPGKISDERLFDIIKRCELSEDEHKELQKRCEKRGIMFLSTPFSIEASDFLDSINVPAFKIGSGELTNIPFLEHIAEKGKPMIISTGMSELEEVMRSVDAIKKFNVPFILLQCTSTYPSKHSDVKLGAMKVLRDEFNVPVGLSDHSFGIYTALGAVALGACLVEKHFTLDRNWPGPDQKLSIEPDELKELVVGSKAIHQALGSEKKIIEDELPVVEFARHCVVAIRDIKAGEILTEENVWVKRPGTGEIHAKDLHRVLGKKAKHDIKYDSQLKWSHIE
ncbi:MAG: N-acetylneuraminate synthase family protein [Candidatus Aenigmatarchaeota archaeon]